MTLLQAIETIDPRQILIERPPAPPAAQAPRTKDPFARANFALWLFLGFEAVMTGILLATWIIFRTTWPEALSWGRQFADLGWAVITTAVLLLGSVAMALAARSARLGERFNLTLFLTLAIMCGICFLGVKTIEFSQKAFESGTWTAPRLANRPAATASLATPAPAKADPAAGQRFYAMICAACHGPRGEGMTSLGLPLRDSALVKQSTPQSLADFIKTGRQPNDPNSKMKAAMPPRGGAAFLSDADVESVANYVKSLAPQAGSAPAPGTSPAGTTRAGSTPAAPAGTASSPAGGPASTANRTAPAATPAPAQVEEVPSWFIPGPTAPAGLLPESLHAVDPAPAAPLPGDPAPPRSAGNFFTFYFLMSGIHAAYLLGGICIAGWLFKQVAIGNANRHFNTPIGIGAMCWHLVTLTWIMLFPLLYLA